MAKQALSSATAATAPAAAAASAAVASANFSAAATTSSVILTTSKEQYQMLAKRASKLISPYLRRRHGYLPVERRADDDHAFENENEYENENENQNDGGEEGEEGEDYEEHDLNHGLNEEIDDDWFPPTCSQAQRQSIMKNKHSSSNSIPAHVRKTPEQSVRGGRLRSDEINKENQQLMDSMDNHNCIHHSSDPLNDLPVSSSVPANDVCMPPPSPQLQSQSSNITTQQPQLLSQKLQCLMQSPQSQQPQRHAITSLNKLTNKNPTASSKKHAPTLLLPSQIQPPSQSQSQSILQSQSQSQSQSQPSQSRKISSLPTPSPSNACASSAERKFNVTPRRIRQRKSLEFFFETKTMPPLSLTSVSSSSKLEYEDDDDDDDLQIEEIIPAENSHAIVNICSHNDPRYSSQGMPPLSPANCKNSSMNPTMKPGDIKQSPHLPEAINEINNDPSKIFKFNDDEIPSSIPSVGGCRTPSSCLATPGDNGSRRSIGAVADFRNQLKPQRHRQTTIPFSSSSICSQSPSSHVSNNNINGSGSGSGGSNKRRRMSPLLCTSSIIPIPSALSSRTLKPVAVSFVNIEEDLDCEANTDRDAPNNEISEINHNQIITEEPLVGDEIEIDDGSGEANAPESPLVRKRRLLSLSEIDRDQRRKKSMEKLELLSRQKTGKGRSHDDSENENENEEDENENEEDENEEDEDEDQDQYGNEKDPTKLPTPSREQVFSDRYPNKKDFKRPEDEEAGFELIIPSSSSTGACATASTSKQKKTNLSLTKKRKEDPQDDENLPPVTWNLSASSSSTTYRINLKSAMRDNGIHSSSGISGLIANSTPHMPSALMQPARGAGSSSLMRSLASDFAVYLQFMISAALDPEFIPSVYEDNDSYFLNAVDRIDTLLRDRSRYMVESNIWPIEFKKNLGAYPEVRKVPSFAQDVCEACGRTGRNANVEITLAGNTYDEQTLQPTLNTDVFSPCYLLGKLCASRAIMYHRLVHFKFRTFGEIQHKVRMIRSNHRDILDEEVVQVLLDDNDWVNNMMERLESLVKEAETFSEREAHRWGS